MDHKPPLVAFVVVTLTCLLMLVHVARSQAMSDWLRPGLPDALAMPLGQRVLDSPELKREPPAVLVAQDVTSAADADPAGEWQQAGAGQDSGGELAPDAAVGTAASASVGSGEQEGPDAGHEPGGQGGSTAPQPAAPPTGPPSPPGHGGKAWFGGKGHGGDDSARGHGIGPGKWPGKWPGKSSGHGFDHSKHPWSGSDSGWGRHDGRKDHGRHGDRGRGDGDRGRGPRHHASSAADGDRHRGHRSGHGWR